MPANMTTHVDTELAAVRRAILTAETAADLRAALAALGSLTAYADELRVKVVAGELDDDALQAARRQARDLRQCAEALAIGV